VESTEKGIANVSIRSAGGDTTMQLSFRRGNMEGIDINRLVWTEGLIESDGLHSYFNVQSAQVAYLSSVFKYECELR